MASDAFFKLLGGSQVHSCVSYPFQWTRYFSFPRTNFELMISSTSYSGSCSTRIGGGGGGCCWVSNCGGMWGVRRTSLNTGHTVSHVRGSLSLYAAAPTFDKISKGPKCLWSSFFEGRIVMRLDPSNRTRSPGL